MNFLKPKPRAVLGIDVGQRRIGLAYCDSLHITVNVLPALRINGDFSEINIINDHILKHKISGIVIGLPLDDKGAMTNQAKHCIQYGHSINSKLEMPYIFVNEHKFYLRNF